MPPIPPSVELDLPSHERIDVEHPLEFALINMRELEADVVITTTVTSEHGAVQRAGVRSVVLPSAEVSHEIQDDDRAAHATCMSPLDAARREPEWYATSPARTDAPGSA